MDILRKIMWSKRPISTPDLITPHQEIQMKTFDSSYSNQHIASISNQNSKVKQGTPQTSSSDSQPQTKLFQVLKAQFLEGNIKSEQSSSTVDLGTVIGIINTGRLEESVIQPESYVIRIGLTQEINSLKSIRSGGLDSLVVFWFVKKSCQYQLNQILRTSHRLVFVVQSWKQLQSLIQDCEDILTINLSQKTLKLFTHRLAFKVTPQGQFFILQFLGTTHFIERFEEVITNKTQLFKDKKEIEWLINNMKVKEYQICKKTEDKSDLQGLFELLKKDMDEDFQELLRKEQIKKIQEQLATEQECTPIPVRKNSSFQAEMAAQYFAKMESQKQTRVSGKQIDYSDFYYFIQDHDQSYEEYSQSKQQSKQLNRRLNSPLRLNRSKSWNQLEEGTQTELDEEFFTKY